MKSLEKLKNVLKQKGIEYQVSSKIETVSFEHNGVEYDTRHCDSDDDIQNLIEELKNEEFKVEGRKGKWYIIDTIHKNGTVYHICEHARYGDMAEHIVVDKNKKELDDDSSYEIIYNQEL